jgi:hypothetical protein
MMSNIVWVISHCHSNNSANPSDHTEYTVGIYDNEELARQKTQELNEEYGYTEDHIFHGDGFLYEEWEVENE